MQLPMEALIYVVIFVGVLLLVEGIYLVAFGKSISLNSRVNRRLDMIDKGVGREQVLEQLRKEMQQHMKTQSIPLYSLLADKAQKAAIAFTPRQLIMIMALVSAVAFMGLSIGTRTDTVLRAAISIAIGVGAVYSWVNHKAKKRMGLLEEQLPDAVELMVRSLRVGNPFVSSVQIVANEVQDPIATEFGVIADECAYGRDVGEALKDMAERLDMQDLRFLAVAVSIQQQSGGNLAEILAGSGQSYPGPVPSVPPGQGDHRRSAMVGQVPVRVSAVLPGVHPGQGSGVLRLGSGSQMVHSGLFLCRHHADPEPDRHAHTHQHQGLRARKWNF